MWWGARPFTQAFVIGVLLLAIWLSAANITQTMERIGITPGFDFLWRSANFEIGESVNAFAAGDPYVDAIFAGLVNTLKVSLLGCVLATILGVALGIAVMSGNLLLATIVRGYIELVRNTPLLLQLFFWISLARAFPAPRQAQPLPGSIFFTNRGVYIPSLSIDGFAGGMPLLLATGLAAGLACAAILNWLAGSLRYKGLISAATGVAVILVLPWAAGASFATDVPVLSGFNIRGGYNLSPELAALLTGLTVKFSAAIAEIVRAGIQSVSRGQWEAARALGLHNGQIMRLVVLPQALRVITPLTTSSYLDLTKDSSLAVAIGYPDLVSIVNTTANTTGQSLEALIILIGTYLAINLAVSAAMNRYNRRVALKGVVR